MWSLSTIESFHYPANASTKFYNTERKYEQFSSRFIGLLHYVAKRR